MGNCMADKRVMSREPDDDCLYAASKREAEREQEGTVEEEEEKKRKTEKKVRFKLEDDDSEGVRGEKGGDLGSPGKGAARRVKVVVTKEELRQILEHAEGSSRRDSSYSLEKLMMTLSSSRSEGGRVYSNGGGNYWRPGLNRIPEQR